MNVKILTDSAYTVDDRVRIFQTGAVIRCNIRLAFRRINHQLVYAVNIFVSQLDMCRKTGPAQTN